MTTPSTHDAEILDQFTRQANPFADHAAHSQQSALELVLTSFDIGPAHDVLDVACGPGLLTSALARVARHVTGVDFVPAMLARARIEQEKRKLVNVCFEQGDARALPYADARFDRVVTRFTFHHFEEPARALAEMARVCMPGGLVAVIDATPDATKRAAYDEVERLRDPSHTSALPIGELEQLFDAQGLARRATVRFRLPMALEPQLAASFPRPGDAERVRALVRADADSGRDTLALGATYEEGALHIAYPCAIVVGAKG